MKKLPIIIILLFSCSVAWGEKKAKHSDLEEITENLYFRINLDYKTLNKQIYLHAKTIDAQQKELELLKARIAKLEGEDR